jgi:RHS repeat-associated protein
MEKDDEVKGSGNSYDFGARMYDSRLGRWLSIDPKMSAGESPYVSMGNTPIWANDPLGDKFKKQEHKEKLEKKIEDRKNVIESNISSIESKIASINSQISPAPARRKNK